MGLVHRKFDKLQSNDSVKVYNIQGRYIKYCYIQSEVLTFCLNNVQLIEVPECLS